MDDSAMELTPEERRRIYEEEKARFEAQEQIKKEMAAKEAALKIEQQQVQAANVKRGCLIVLAVIIGIGLFSAVVEQWPKWFPSAKDRAWEASSAKRFKVTDSLDASKEALKQRAGIYAMAGMIEEMQALFEARWRELEKLSAETRADTSMDEIHKESISSELEKQRTYVSDVLSHHAELYRHRIKGKAVQSVVVLGKEIKVGDTEAYVNTIFPFDDHYEAYSRIVSFGVDEAQYQWEHLYITQDMALEVTFNRPSKVVRLFVRDSIPVSEQKTEAQPGEKVNSIAIRGKEVRVGDAADAVFEILKKNDRVMRPTVESDPKDPSNLRVTQHYRVEGKRFNVTLSRPEPSSAYQVEAITLLK